MNNLTINLGQPNSFRPGGFGGNNFMPAYSPMGGNWGNGWDNDFDGGGCEHKKEKKDHGLIGDLVEGIFGKDSILGRLMGLDGEDKKKHKKHRHHDCHEHRPDRGGCGSNGRGAQHIAINVVSGSRGLGF